MLAIDHDLTMKHSQNISVTSQYKRSKLNQLTENIISFKFTLALS